MRAQPRRVAKHRKNGKVFGFATYQYLELAHKFKDPRCSKHRRHGRNQSKLKFSALTFIFAIDKAIQNAIDAVVKLDKERYLKNNPNAYAIFLPERVYPDVPKLELRNEAFHKLENNVTVTKV